MEHYYVGLTDNGRKVFASLAEPTKQSHGHLYRCTIGPFRTKQAAQLMVNPFCQLQTVEEAEAQAKKDKRNRARREREQAMRDCGLVKVRGTLGGVYWE